MKPIRKRYWYHGDIADADEVADPKLRAEVLATGLCYYSAREDAFLSLASLKRIDLVEDVGRIKRQLRRGIPRGYYRPKGALNVFASFIPPWWPRIRRRRNEGRHWQVGTAAIDGGGFVLFGRARWIPMPRQR